MENVVKKIQNMSTDTSAKKKKMIRFAVFESNNKFTILLFVFDVGDGGRISSISEKIQRLLKLTYLWDGMDGNDIDFLE